jgi:acyl-CoA reductase-like NAD-dependent aldehyde dehydrogenase
MAKGQRTAKLYIDGAWSDASEGATFVDTDPETDQPYALAARAGVADVQRAVHAADAAFAGYSSTTPKEREHWLMQAAHLMAERKSQFIDVLIDEIGSPVKKAEFEFGKALSMLRAAAGVPRQCTGKTLPSDQPGRFSYSVRRPIGPVAAVTPFNVPLIKGIRLSANPLALGNTVVMLASEDAPVMANLVAQLYQDAGLPPGAFNLLTGFGHEIGDDLTSHPAVRMITFTGSSRVGQHIQRLAAAGNKRVTLELGGKSPMVVLEDADLGRAVEGAIHGVYTFQGQVCMGNGRIYVEDGVHDRFLALLVERVGALGMGDLRDPATTIGPIISSRQRERVRGHIEDAVVRGARLLTGGRWRHNRCEPTLLTGVDESMVVCRQETFGPVAAVYRVADYAQALEQANATDYGLSAAIFTRDIDKALHFAGHIGAGMCHINASALQDEPHVPFGGNGASGFGREGTEADIEAMTELRWVTINS